MLAMFSAAIALGILFSSKTFPLPPKTRLWLLLLATVTIGFFSEFRNEGKFFFKNLGHYFGPGMWSRSSAPKNDAESDFPHSPSYATLRVANTNALFSRKAFNGRVVGMLDKWLWRISLSGTSTTSRFTKHVLGWIGKHYAT